MPGGRRRRYLIIVGWPGEGLDHVGRAFRVAAETYARELSEREEFDPALCRIDIRPVQGARELCKAIAEEAVFELAYFGLGWSHADGGSGGILHLGPGRDGDANLGPAVWMFRTDLGTILSATPLIQIPRNFAPDATIRLFSSRGGSGGSRSMAAGLAAHLGVVVCAYASRNPVIFTADERLAKGQRRWKNADRGELHPADADALWAIPVQGDLTMDEFRPPAAQED